MPRWFLRLILLLALNPAVAGAADGPQIFAPSAGWDPPQDRTAREQDLLFSDPFTGDYQNLGFNTMGRLDDGSVYSFNIFRWRVALAGAWGISVAIRLADGTAYTYGGKIEDVELSLEAGRMSLRFDGGSIEGADGFYRIRLTLPDLVCDLSLRPVLPPWIPGDGYAYLDGKHKAYSRLGISSPWARVRGSMVVRGRELRADGDCYGDRTLHNLPLHKLHSPTFAFHAWALPGVPTHDGWSLSVISAAPHPSYELPPVQVLLLARGNQWLFAGMDFSVQPTAFIERDDLAAPYPSRFVLHATHNGATLAGTYYNTHRYQSDDVLGQAPAFVRAVGSLFLRQPVMYRFAGSFEGSLILPDGERIPLHLSGPAEYAVLK